MENNVRPESMKRIETPELAKAFIDEQIALGGKPKQRAEMAISRGYVPGRS